MSEITVPKSAMFYDRLTVNPGESIGELIFFYASVGMNGKTLSDTNLQRGRVMEDYFLIEGVILQASSADLWDDAYFQFEINNRIVIQFGVNAARLSGLATATNNAVDYNIIGEQCTFGAGLRWRSYYSRPEKLVFSVVVVGKVLPRDAKLRVKTMPPISDIFARMLVDADAQFKDISNLRVLDFPDKPTKRELVKTASRKFNFED